MPTLSEAQVEALLASELSVDDQVSWKAGSKGWVRAVVAIQNKHELPIRMVLQASSVVPGKYSLSLMNGSQVLRRLDVRGSHVNPAGCDPAFEKWIKRTHKHRFTDAHGESCAYTPTDIPDTDGVVTPPEYRSVYEAFCAECGIEVMSEWAEPFDGAFEQGVLGDG